MDEFKLRSINEFDEDFAAEVKALRAAKVSPAPAPVPQQKKETLIPEMSKPAVEEPIEIDFFSSGPVPAPQTPAAPVTPPAPAAPVAAAVPPVSLYKTEKTDSSSVKPFVYEPQKFEDDDDDDDYYKNSDNKDRTKLFLAGKIVSIVMLALTLLFFIFGCFITIFYDNKDSSFAGYTFSSLAEDNAAISSSKNGDPEKAGALIVSKKVEAGDYKSGDLVAVPADESGCDVYQVISIGNETSEGFDLIVIDNADSASTASLTVASEDIFGKAVYSLGGLGKLVGFATSNLVLVCILFLLLAAFWCILIVLIEKMQAKQNEEKEEDEDINIR